MNGKHDDSSDDASGSQSDSVDRKLDRILDGLAELKIAHGRHAQAIIAATVEAMLLTRKLTIVNQAFTQMAAALEAVAHKHTT